MTDKRIDPSGVKQYFDEIKLNLHCCRYWKFTHWNFEDLSAPFWRLYFNNLPGAVVSYKGSSMSLNNHVCLLIPPNTAFSISTIYNRSESIGLIEGSRMAPDDSPEQLLKNSMFDHLFIHFNLGLKYDGYQAGLYSISTDQVTKSHFDSIKSHLLHDHEHIPFSELIHVYGVIFNAIGHLPSNGWLSFNYDLRILAVLTYIDKNLCNNLTNVLLAQKVNLATNSFARLFRENMDVSVQQYVQKRRLEKSMHMLHHTQASMSKIASECGFYDLHHFSRIFKKATSVSPSEYKKKKTME